jgi:hypothetical protein
MRARLTPAAVALAVFAGGCGHATSQRALVASYIKRVDRIEAELTQPLAAVSQAGSEFVAERAAGASSANDLLTLAHERALLRGWVQIRALGRELSAVKAPRPAVHLRALLLELIDGQAKMTREVAQLVVFVPRFAASLRPLGAATAQLARVLSEHQAFGPAAVAAVFAAKAGALRGFKADIGAVLMRLRRLHPPAVARPSYDAQLAALEGMSSSAGQLASALDGGAQSSVSQLLLEFDRAATSNQTIAAQRAQIAAVSAYNAQGAKLTGLTREIELERLRLANALR